jgi:uncharacterized Zn-finger protein
MMELNNWRINMAEDIDTWDDNELICPYCGHHQEVDETFEGDDLDFETEEVQCEECGKTFIASREVEIHYQAYKK